MEEQAAEAVPQETTQIDQFITDTSETLDAENSSEDSPQEETASEQVNEQEAPTKETGKLHAAFDELNRRESEVRKKETELKSLEQQTKSYTDLQTLAKENPLEFLKEVGTSYEEITNKIISEPETQTQENQTLKELKSQVDTLLQEKKQRVEFEDKSNREQQVESYMSEVQEHLSDNEEQYELCLLNWDTAAKDLFLAMQSQYANQMLKSYGEAKILPMGEVLESVEKYFESQMDLLTKSKKYQSRKTSNSESKPPIAQSQKSQSKTLTTKQTHAPESTATKKLMTEEERLEAAVAVLKGVKTA